MMDIRHSVKRLSSLFRFLRKKKIDFLPVVAAVVWTIFLGLFCPAFIYFLYILFSDKSDLYVKAAFLLLDVKTKNEALKFLGISMGGLLVGLQAFISYRRAKAMEDTVENTEKGMRQERLKNAIEHLGHESASIRLGGAYELFHLAQDTKELRQTVLDILCSHIRRTTSEDEYRDKHSSKPSEEIQSLLTLLFVQEHEVFKGLQINLQGSWLNGATLHDARLVNAVLNKAYLRGASLGKAWLQGARLLMTQLQGALLSDAKLQGATLIRTMLQASDLRGAQLQGAWLADVKLQGSKLENAMLQGALLYEAFLQEAVLGGVQLHGVTAGDHIQTYSFETIMRDRIGEASDFSRVTFEGGLSNESMDSLVEGLSNYATQTLRRKLIQHIDKPASHELPENSGAITGSYTKEEAEQWIAEYKAAMSEVKDEDDS